MAKGGELSPAVQTVEQFAVARPEFGADGLGLRRDGVVRPTQVSSLGHTPVWGAGGKYSTPRLRDLKPLAAVAPPRDRRFAGGLQNQTDGRVGDTDRERGHEDGRRGDDHGRELLFVVDDVSVHAGKS